MRMDHLGNEIIQQVRTEITVAIQDVFSDFFKQFDAKNAESDKKLVDFSNKLDAVQSASEQARDGTNAIDLSVVNSANALMHATAAKNLDEQIALISEQLAKMQADADSRAATEQAAIQKVSERLQPVEDRLEQICQSLGAQAAGSGMAQDLQTLGEQLMWQHKEIRVELAQMTALREELPIKQDMRSIAEQVKRTEHVLNVDFQLILAEVCKLQKGMQMEFVQLVEFTGGKQNTKGPSPPPSVAPEITAVEPVAVGDDGDDGDGETSKRLGLTVSKRAREFGTQTVSAHKVDKSEQTEAKYLHKRQTVLRKTQRADPPAKDKPIFADAEAMKAKARMALVKPQYNVFDSYHTTGIAQKIAKHPWFENFTLLVVCLNSVWMAVDTDHNNQALIQDMHPVFITGEMLFCLYFTAEVIIRFSAFAEKWNCLRDAWFVFDSFLVSIMVFETWLLPILTLLVEDLRTGLQGLNLGTLRLIRMVKILRLSRMAKLLRAFPELKIIVKGIRFAFRSVGVFFLLWMMIIFVTAILMTQLNGSFETTDGFGKLFERVDISMETLLLYGVLPNQASLLRTAMDANPVFWLIILFFVMLASVTIMYMLMGVLVEVMSVISASEKEGMTVSYVATQLRDTMGVLNKNPDEPLSRTEFEKFLMEPRVARTISGVGVDIGTMLDMMDIIFEDLQKKGISGLPFEKMVDVILHQRGANTATVKDVTELLRVLKSIFNENLASLQKKLQDEIYLVRTDVGALRREKDGAFTDTDEEG